MSGQKDWKHRNFARFLGPSNAGEVWNLFCKISSDHSGLLAWAICSQSQLEWLLACTRWSTRETVGKSWMWVGRCRGNLKKWFGMDMNDLNLIENWRTWSANQWCLQTTNTPDYKKFWKVLLGKTPEKLKFYFGLLQPSFASEVDFSIVIKVQKSKTP